MAGAIAGDIIGCVYEWHKYKRTDFPLFNLRCRITDDSVLTEHNSGKRSEFKRGELATRTKFLELFNQFNNV